MPGFTANDLEVRLGPRRLGIAGKREAKLERRTGKALYSESCVDQFFRLIDLPAEVNPEKATATLKDGILQIVTPKVEAVQQLKAEARLA